MTDDKAYYWWTKHMEDWAILPSQEGGLIMKGVAEHFMTPEGGVKEFVEGKTFSNWHTGVMMQELTREDYDGFMANYEYT